MKYDHPAVDDDEDNYLYEDFFSFFDHGKYCIELNLGFTK